MKNKNWFWGLFFIGAAATIILSRRGYLNNVNLVSLVFTILLIPVIIKSISHVNFLGILFPIAVISIIYAEPLGITDLTPWPVLITAILGSIGLSILFKKSWPHKHLHEYSCKNFYNSNNEENFGEVINCPDDEIIECKVNMGSSIKYVNSDNFKKARLTCSFGALKVYFDNAKPSVDGAEICLDVSFGGVELYIPKEWQIKSNLNASLGGVDEKNRPSNINGPIVFLNGEIKLSGIEIIYI